jgi:hybrid cluster-associated redox disulfide protein
MRQSRARICEEFAPEQRACARVGHHGSMRADTPIAAHDLVDDVMRRRPETIRVFLDHRMRCIGCPVAGFHTVADACREHGTPIGAFLDALRAA